MHLESAAEALKHSFETGDRAPFEALFAPGCISWHQSDKVERDAASFAGMAAFHGAVRDITAEIVQHEMFPSGQLIQLVVRGTVKSNNRPLYAHFCFVLRTSDLGIVRIEDFDDQNLIKAFEPLPG